MRSDFLSLPQNQQRIEIAKDVVKQLNTKELVATRGTWLEFNKWPGYFKKGTQLKSVLDTQTNCQVCALGGLFVSAVKSANAICVEDAGYMVNYDKEEYNINVDFERIKLYLSRFFEPDQLNQIESAFEQGRGAAKDPLACYFVPEVTDPEERMILIMQNIIDNDGTFIHGVNEVPIDEQQKKLLDDYGFDYDNYDEDDLELLAEGLENHGQAFADFVNEFDLNDDFDEYYEGKWDSEEAFAANFLEDTEGLNSIPDYLRQYFDYEAYARDLFINDYLMSDNGFVFRRG